MSHSPHPVIAREGWPYPAVAFPAAAGLTGLRGRPAAIVVWLLFFFILQFFGDPSRLR